MIRYIGKRFFVRLVLLTAVILGVVGLFSWAEGGPTEKLGLSPFRETQYVYVNRGITVPVSGKGAQGTIRALAEDLRYDDLLDLYPSLGTWPHRMTEVGQMYFPTCFVMRQGKDAWVLSLIGAERPQVKVWKLKNIEGQWETEWEDFYQSRNPELLESLLALEKAIGQKGVSALQ